MQELVDDSEELGEWLSGLPAPNTSRLGRAWDRLVEEGRREQDQESGHVSSGRALRWKVKSWHRNQLAVWVSV